MVPPAITRRILAVRRARGKQKLVLNEQKSPARMRSLFWRRKRMATKTCNICNEVKSLESFSVHKKGAQGRHPACKACRSRQARNDYSSRHDEILEIKRERRRRTGADRKHSYGITPEQYQAMVDAQGGQCAVCGDVVADSGLHVDHCHSTGKIRGLLCRHCNLALGNMRDDVSRLRRAITYLTKHR